MSKIQDLLSKQLDNDSGAELILSQCNIHGKELLTLVLSNQGGHDATLTCLKCIKELISLLENDSDDISEFVEELKRKKLYSKYCNIKSLEDARDKLISKLLKV